MSCKHLDRDQTFTVHDFGPCGYIGQVAVNLTHGLQPGAMLSAVVLTDSEMFLNVWDANKNALLSFGARIAKNELACNSLIDGKWGTELKAAKNPWLKGVRATLSVLYDSEGYRIFVNGESVLFLPHRSTSRPSKVEISSGQVFKVVYQTTMDIIP